MGFITKYNQAKKYIYKFIYSNVIEIDCWMTILWYKLQE